MQSASKINKIETARLKLRGELNREPTNSEIAEAVRLTERTVSGLRHGKVTTISLHDPIQEGEEGEFRDIIPDESATTPDDFVEESETMDYMLKLIHHLEERERRILQLRFGLDGERPHTLEELTTIIGRTRERIRQIQNQALQKLRSMLEDQPLDELVGEELVMPEVA
jgi:RNA polymerase primary sigma factor